MLLTYAFTAVPSTLSSTRRSPAAAKTLQRVGWLQALQKALDWLAEQPEDASELAALLSEAVPKLGFNAQKSRLPGISRAATTKQSLDLLHADMSLLQRLQAARPMLVGMGCSIPASLALIPAIWTAVGPLVELWKLY